MTEVLQQEEPKQNGDIPPSVDIDSQQNLLNGSSSKRRSTSVDPDAQEMLISSLRTQIQDLFAQVSQLNSKLVKSYDRISDLEDDLHVASANLRSSSLKISHLELERSQHLSALNTGLLVEKSHVTTELNRLMEKATDEAAQRGQAESARIAIEKELDDLSASLFDQANNMVAEARFGKHLSERKVEDAERALKSAEEAVQLMQVQMQSMQAEKEETEQRSRKMEMMVSKGKWVESGQDDISVSLRLMNSHGPYQDYLAFLSHLRVLRLTSPSPPTMTTLLPLPFLARLLNEDSEPTVRLDLAPSLNWLSRRSVLAAIHSGQLTIEPISAASLCAESTPYASSTTIAGVNSNNDNISCALCSTSIFPVTESSHLNRPPPTIPSNINPTSWSGSFFKRTSSMGYTVNSRPPSPPHPTTTLSSIDSSFQIYIFKLASPPTSTMSSLPISSLTKSYSQSTSSSIPLQSASIHNGLMPSANPNNQSVTIYPLCRTGWCLSRLRTTCTLWAFVRTGIVDKVWQEPITLPTPPSPVPSPTKAEKPPLPPRKRGLWGIASAIGERAASWSEGDKDKTKKPPNLLNPQEQRKSHVTPPPQQRDQPISAVPPPLPKRNRNSAITSHHLRPNVENLTNTSASTAVPASSTSTTVPSTTTVPSSVATLPPVQETPVHIRTSSSSDFPAPPKRSSIRTSLPITIDRPLTPSNIPLPESRPSTPPVIPSRTASPAAVGRVGAPPPLPRRAVSRGVRAPPPSAAAAAAASVSRSGTPVNGVESAAKKAPQTLEQTLETEEVDNRGVRGSTVAAAAASVSRSGTPVNGVESAAKKAQTEGVDTRGVRGTAASVSRSGTPVNGVESATKKAQTLLETEEVDTRGVRGTAAASVSRSGTPVNGVESAAKKAQTLETEEVDTRGVRSAAAAAAAASVSKSDTPPNGLESVAEKAETLETEEVDMGQYVGDDSWEEKTWKELVRLREDMFWARLGGLRD